ncbi:MAG: ATP-binding protein [Actinomycetota bacterium]|nr:ATP-binding protein [Actinomycetota bacterium]MDQ6947453.1 ATP-binding protein [Actinomycetota bacterium]
MTNAAAPDVVFRESLLNDMLEAIAGSGRRVYDLVGLTGSGKSTLLQRLYAASSASGSRTVVMVDLTQYAPGGSTASGADRADSGAGLADLTRYLRLVRDVSGRAGAGFDTVAAEANSVTVQAIDRMPALGSSFSVWTHEEAVRIAGLFVDEWNRSTSESRGIVLLDNVHRVLDGAVGEWLFRNLVSRLENTAVIAARTATPKQLPHIGYEVVPRRLDGITAPEIAAFLAARLRLPEVLKPPEAAELIETCFAITGGNPAALEIISGLIASNLTSGAARLIGLVSNPPADVAGQLDALVARALAVASDPALERAMRLVCVARRFEPGLLERVLGLAEGDDFVERLIPALEGHGFAAYQEPTEDEPGFFRFDGLIQRQLEKRLSQSPNPYHQAHGKAEAWYFRKWTVYADDYKSAYLLEARVEQAEFQHLVLEWLYHVARFGRPAEYVRQRFARRYFQAFWWWGMYLEYPFCQLLLEAIRNEGSWAIGWYRALTLFAEAYPLGPDKEGRGDWDSVRQALDFVLAQTGTAGDVDQFLGSQGPDEDACTVRALTDLFLAHSCRYRRAGPMQDRWRAEAADYYEDAKRLFDEIEDNFNIAWVLYEWGDLDHERGLDHEAQSKVEQGLRHAIDTETETKRDYEVIANCRRSLGDISMAGDVEAAFSSYAQAVGAAYVFQVWPESLDAYTAAFYDEITDTVWRRFERLRSGGQIDLAWSAYWQLASFWARARLANPPVAAPLDRASFASATAAIIRDSIFPGRPPPEQIGDPLSRYAAQVTTVAPTVSRLV